MKPKSSFLLNFFSLNAVSLAIKILNFLFFILLVRILSIQEYGIYVLIWTQVNFFTPLLDFGTTSYGLVYIDEDKKAKLNSLLSLRMALGIAIFIIVIFSGLFYSTEKNLVLLIFLASFTVFANVMYGSFVILMSLRQKAYISSLYSFIFTIILVASSSTVVFLTKSLLCVFIIVFVLYSLNAFVSWILIQKINGEFHFKYDPTLWKEIISKSYIFVLISFFLGIYFKIDVFLLKFLKSDTDVGIYSAGYKFFESLLFIIGAYILSATPLLSKLYKESSALFVKKIFKDGLFLAILGTGIAICTYFIAPPFLTIVLKQVSGASAHVLQIVIFALPFMLVSTVLTNGLYILNKAKLIIYVYIFQIILNTVLNFIFIPAFSYIASSYITVLNEIINVVVLLLLFQHFKKVSKIYNE